MRKYYEQATALGSQVEVCLVTHDDARAGHLMRNLWRQIFTFERRFSRFLPGSELSVFNRKAGSAEFISHELRDILVAAKALSEETDGLYNPFILPALQAAGYVGSLVKGHEQDQVDDFSSRAVPNARVLEIGDTWARIPKDAAIDLGGCGKGYLADQLAESIENEVAGFWVSLGGDIVAAGKNEMGDDWSIGVQSAQEAAIDIATAIAPGGSRLCIATSGTTQRRGTQNGKPWHHLIDPKTLQPAETDVRLATIAAKSAVEADVLASCGVILGLKKAIPFLKGREVQAALLQGADGQWVHFGKRIQLHTADHDR